MSTFDRRHFENTWSAWEEYWNIKKNLSPLTRKLESVEDSNMGELGKQMVSGSNQPRAVGSCPRSDFRMLYGDLKAS